MSRKITPRQVIHGIHKANDQKVSYLKQQGWDYVCFCSHWFFSKRVKGRQVLLNTDLAFEFEQYISEQGIK